MVDVIHYDSLSSSAIIKDRGEIMIAIHPFSECKVVHHPHPTQQMRNATPRVSFPTMGQARVWLRKEHSTSVLATMEGIYRRLSGGQPLELTPSETRRQMILEVNRKIRSELISQELINDIKCYNMTCGVNNAIKKSDLKKMDALPAQDSQKIDRSLGLVEFDVDLAVVLTINSVIDPLIDRNELHEASLRLCMIDSITGAITSEKTKGRIKEKALEIDRMIREHRLKEDLKNDLRPWQKEVSGPEYLLIPASMDIKDRNRR